MNETGGDSDELSDDIAPGKAPRHNAELLRTLWRVLLVSFICNTYQWVDKDIVRLRSCCDCA